MANRGDRGGARTKAHISDTATHLFVERGFDQVTVADVAAAAGVSKVTVFAHFERKEDLLLDRLPGAVEIVRRAVRDRATDADVIDAVHETALSIARERHVLSGLNEGVEPFLRLVAESPALTARLRGFEREAEAALADELRLDERFAGDPALTAALLVAAYRTVALATARRRLAGDDLNAVAAAHATALDAAFDAVAHGLPAAES